MSSYYLSLGGTDKAGQIRRHELRAFIAAERQALEARNTAVEQSTELARAVLLGGGAIALLLGLLIAAGLGRHIAGRLRHGWTWRTPPPRRPHRQGARRWPRRSG